MEASSTGGQGTRRAVASNDDDELNLALMLCLLNPSLIINVFKHTFSSTQFI